MADRRTPGRRPSVTLARARPDLAAQLIDPVDALYGVGSDHQVWWRCPVDPRHVWRASVLSRTHATGAPCPVCRGRRVIAGVNDVATTDPGAAALIADPALRTTLTCDSNKVVDCVCPHDPRHRWRSPVSRLHRRQGCGCPYCSGRYVTPGVNDLKTTHPDLAAQLADLSLATTLGAGSNRRVCWRCSHGHEWVATPYGRTAEGTGCPYCSGRRRIAGVNDLATSHPDLAATLVDPSLACVLGPGSDRRVAWRCSLGHVWHATVANRLRSGCPACAGRKTLAGFNDLKTTHPDLAAQLVDPALAARLTAGSGRRVEWRCPEGHVWTTAVYNRVAGGTDCPCCAEHGPSRGESELLGIVEALLPGVEVVDHDRTVLSGHRELDIAIPSLHVAVEYNGVYWHCDAAGKASSYHADKLRDAAAAGWRLIEVWEDDWRDRREVVIRMLAHKLHADERLAAVLPGLDPKAYGHAPARTLTVERIDGARARMFLAANHIQGPVGASLHLGLVDADGDIRALLCLRRPSSNARMRRAAGQWDIQRYATHGIVPGGFTRLLAHAATVLRADGERLDEWVTFAAHDVSDGGLYAKAGFTVAGELGPDYMYVGNATGWRRASKERFQRRRFRDDPDLAWDESWTEAQAAEANGLHRIWDCGKVKWVRPVD